MPHIIDYDELALMIAIVANVDPDLISSPKIKSLVYKCKAMAQYDRYQVTITPGKDYHD